MTNKEIARAFRLLGKLMEMEGENPFKIRSYESAAGLLSKLGTPLSEMTEEEIKGLKGVGSAISGKIQELLAGGKMKTLERYKEKVPEGIQEMLQIKGLGAKKVKVAWDELGVENATELLYACNENRLIELKGFGAKTQEEIRKQLEFFLRNRSNVLFANVELAAKELLDHLRSCAPGLRWEMTGDLRRQEQVLGKLEYLMEYADEWPNLNIANLQEERLDAGQWEGIWGEQTKVIIYKAAKNGFEDSWLKTTGPEALTGQWENQHFNSEELAFQSIGYPLISAECRTSWIGEYNFPEKLVNLDDIRGVIHAHTTSSDGIHTLREMSEYSQDQGYSYLAVTDHSQIAVYADGMDEPKVLAQWEEIDQLNRQHPQFRIIKGIECDILNDGSLDYDDDLRSGFELVIASIHTNIKMDEEKATARLIRAIEHPHTNMVGHPTGRLLLGRSGYPLDIHKVIDACAANQVAIEINASPYRLDLDWKYIPYAVERGVMLSINPDAHAKEAIDQIRFGAIIARKGWLPMSNCLNAQSAEEFLQFCKKNG
ncbi:MAG: DNA polymerase/3'-5' exonuclease PolX [Saprospiraceae bacterium]|nr:DNA polymerase/3'-5' exonuclease PolX [Saprospiraceae bacterium]